MTNSIKKSLLILATISSLTALQATASESKVKEQERSKQLNITDEQRLATQKGIAVLKIMAEAAKGALSSEEAAELKSAAAIAGVRQEIAAAAEAAQQIAAVTPQVKGRLMMAMKIWAACMVVKILVCLSIESYENRVVLKTILQRFIANPKSELAMAFASLQMGFANLQRFIANPKGSLVKLLTNYPCHQFDKIISKAFAISIFKKTVKV